MNAAKATLERRLKEVEHNIAQYQGYLANAQKMVVDNQDALNRWEKDAEHLRAAIALLDQNLSLASGEPAIEYYKRHPAEWIEKFLGLKLTPYQREIVESAGVKSDG